MPTASFKDEGNSSSEDEVMPRSSRSRRGQTTSEDVAPPVTASSTRAGEKRVIIMESSFLSADPSRLIRLRHPRTQNSSTFLMDSAESKLRELLTYTEEHRSWFVDETIESNGNIFMAAHVDPLLILLPYLMGGERPVPLDHLVKDEEFPHIHMLTKKDFTKHISKVANSKGPADLNVWLYDESKTLDYLANKVNRVSEALIDEKINIEGGAVSGSYVKSINSDVDKMQYIRYAHGMLSEYLSPELSAKLSSHMKIPAEEKNIKKRESTDKMEGNASKKRKSDLTSTSEGPEEDYSKGYKKAAVKESPQNAKQKALVKAASGSKSITSFFKKK